jgi:chromosomal replication initiation ATPase DnaA
MSLPQIGRRLGGRDHTTVLHGIRRHCELNGLPYPRPRA